MVLPSHSEHGSSIKYVLFNGTVVLGPPHPSLVYNLTEDAGECVRHVNVVIVLVTDNSANPGVDCMDGPRAYRRPSLNSPDGVYGTH